MKPFGVGYLKDGSLGLLLRLWMPGDDEFHYLFKRDGNGQWSILDERWCGRWGCENPIEALAFKSTNVWHWPESGMIWHPNLALNPYFIGQSVQMIDLEYEDYQAEAQKREFVIDGTSSTLGFYTSPSEHSDTNHTFGIELAANGNPPTALSGNQCLTSIVGRYILVYEFFQGRFEVTDIGTGKVAIGNLKAARWLD